MKKNNSSIYILLLLFSIILSELLTVAPIVIPKMLGANIPMGIIIAYLTVTILIYGYLLLLCMTTAITLTKGNKNGV